MARLLFILLACFTFAPLSLAQQDDQDPFIEVNRSIYRFNQAFDEIIVKPVTKTYDWAMPTVAKRGVSNFFSNLDDVNVVFNDVLQLKMRNTLHDSSRLVINTTIGVGGLLDVATQFGLHKNNEDFGQTLGHWGVGAGPYIVVPFLGTSSLRDAIGFVPDYLMNPIFWVDDEATRHALYTLDTIDTRLYYMAAESMITGDEYIFVRDAYLQRREYLVNDGVVYDEWDDF